MASAKPIHSIVLDAGPILKNEPSISTLLAQSEALFTVPSVIAEIRDASARSRVETTLLPFLVLKSPKPQSIKLVTGFAQRTGDLSVLSGADIQILALAHELECERNRGDWRLRNVPGQKRLNGAPPNMEEAGPSKSTGSVSRLSTELEETTEILSTDSAQPTSENADAFLNQVGSVERTDPAEMLSFGVQNIRFADKATSVSLNRLSYEPTLPSNILDVQEHTIISDESDSEGWITPSNIKKHQAQNNPKTSGTPSASPTTMQVATVTTDFALQNVLLLMNLNLLSPSLQRIRHLKTYILRCHACFQQTKDMDKQFCPRCGKPTLMRVACSTDQNGEFKLHLKKNIQWNTRGNRYSIPKPVSGSANGKIGASTGGGKGGWGQGLVLAEDQKEYVQALKGQGRRKERNLMDEDYLPSILTGARNRAGGRTRVGGGRNINSRKR
ncbi:MAG: Nin1 binding protein [Pleopsidium flavum]|nr:MAG: Nin1 binding protein [Pleopsidium flavum]